VLDAATQGEWRTCTTLSVYPDHAIIGPLGEPVAEMGHDGEQRHHHEAEDARLICLAVNSLPALIAAAREREALRDANENWRAAYNHAMSALYLVEKRDGLLADETQQQFAAIARMKAASTLENQHEQG